MKIEGLFDPKAAFEAPQASAYLGLATAEKRSLFFENYPSEAPPEGWQAWMVQRLTKIIETGEV